MTLLLKCGVISAKILPVGCAHKMSVVSTFMGLIAHCLSPALHKLASLIPMVPFHSSLYLHQRDLASSRFLFILKGDIQMSPPL